MPSLSKAFICRLLQATIFALSFLVSTSFSNFLVKPAFATAGINRQINFQGKLVNANGTNVTTDKTLIFTIYDAPSDGTALWTETDVVTITDGIFRTTLGDGTTLPGSIDFNTDNLYLGIKVSTEVSEMSPRIQFAAVPYAFNALKVAGLTVTNTTGTFTLAAAKTLTVNNTLTFAGTDATSFTFPSTTGGTVLTGNAPTQTITSAQTSGTVLSISDSTAITAATVGQSISLTGTGAFDQTGLKITLSGATGTNLNALVVNDGTNDTALLSKSGVLTLGKSAATSGQLKFKDSTTSFTTTFQPSTSATADVTYTLPTAGPSVNGYVLTSQTTGALSWTANGAGGGCATCLQQVPGLDSDNTVVPTADVLGLLVKQTSNVSPTKNIFGVVDSGGTNFAIKVDSSKNLTFGNTTNNNTFAFNGSGTFTTSTGTNTLSGNTTISAGKNLTLPSGAGQFAQTYTTAVAGNAQALSFANTNAGAGITVGGVDITPTNNTTPSSLTNTLNVISFEAGTLAASQVTNGLNFASATGYSNFLKTPSIVIDSAGAVTGATGITTATGNMAITAGALTLNGVTRITNAGVGTFITGTVLGSQTFTTNNIVDSGALTIKSGGTSALTLDTSGAAALNLGNTNATSLVFGNVTTNPTFSFNGSGLTTLGGNLTFSGTTARTITGPNTGAASALTVTTAGNVSGLTLNTANGASGNSGAISLASGTVTTSGTSGSVTIATGASNTNALNTGLILIQSGNITSSGTSGNVGLEVGTGGTLGTINIGNATAAPINIGSSGTAAKTIAIGSTAGDTIQIGSGATSAKTIQIGNGAVANTITVGNASATGVSVTDDNWSITAAGAATFVSTTSPTYTGAGAVTVSSGGSSGLTFDSASGDITVAANDGLTFAATTLGNNGSRNVTINSGTGGTTATLLVKLDTSGTVVTTDTTTLNNAVGVALNTTTIGQPVRVAINGVVTATADNAVTAGDYIGLGTTTAGRAKSLGTTYPSTAGVQVIGRALGTQATPGLTFLLMLNGLDNNAGGGGGGYNLIKEETTGLTARTTLAFLGTAMTCADNAGLTQTECTISSTGGGVSFASGTPDNTVTSNNLIHLQKSGVNKFVVANSGGLTITASTSDVVKTTTGTTLATDFSLAGSTLTNVTSSNDLISIDNGAVTNTMSTSTVVTAAATGAGSHSIMRDDGQYIIIHGNSSATASRWTGNTADAMVSVTVATGAVLPGAGAISLKRPDGRYLLIHGNASAGLTSVFDPYNVTAAAAGPAVCGGGAATTGTNAFLRDDGVYVILCGNLTAWGTYNPTTNVYTAGTVVAVAFGAGAHAIRRDDGTFLIFRGANTTTHWIYNPYASATGTMTQDPITANQPTVNTGSFSIRRADGKYLVMGGAANTSHIYDPTRTSANSGAGTMTAQTVSAGFGPTSALADGAQALWRQDGKYLLITGTTNVTNVIDPSKTDNTQFVAGPNLNANAAAGIHGIMRADGAMQIMRGGATTTTDVYNTGFIIGGSGSGTQLASYETECITSTNLNSTSTLKWTKNAEAKMWFQVKTGTGACSGAYKDVLNSGDLINPTAGDNRVQIKVFFQRDFPKFADQEWGLRRGLGQVRYRRTNKDPALYDIQVDNSTAFHRNQFEFGNSTDPSGPIFVNLSNDRDRELAVALEYGVGYGSTILNTANLGIAYAGAFTEHPALTTGITGFGTLVMRKPDGKYIIIAGTAAANAMEYDANTQTITAQAGAGNIPTAATGKGAAAFKRPDGKFLIIMGANTTTTNIYDPLAASGSRFTAGPAVTGAVERGASLIPLPNGRLLIIHGNNLATTSIYDPFQNTMVAGPVTSAAVGHGSLAIPRPDGTYFVPLGNPAAAGTCATTNTVTNHFSPYTMAFTNNTEAMSATPGEGAFAVQRSDGMWWIFHGNGGGTTCTLAATTTLYNPFTNQAVAGPATTNVTTPVNLGGQHAIPRPDGSWLFVHGAGLSTTSICKEKVGAVGADSGVPIGICIAGPSIGPANPGTALTVNSGATSFQRDDGKHVMMLGNVTSQTTTIRLYDGGWVGNGTYRSEALNIADLDTSSALVWQSNAAPGAISAEVRTATSKDNLQVANFRELPVSGGLINPGGSEVWLQVNFNFKRGFPSYPGIQTDVWGNNSNGSYPVRKIDKPILNEFKITKDVDLVNLKTDGLSVFRVSSSGDIYTSSYGSFNTGGADLAENYTSQTHLEKGEVVSIDPQNSHGVQRSKYQYQPDVLGVVSSDPGFVAGSYTKDSYPIALVGRVSVKVSTENGIIRTGDNLTSSSVPGYAMKATQAGRVLGKTLENLDTSKLVDCPESQFAVSSRKCGEVMMFVNLVDYLGAPVELVMAEKAQAKNTSEVLGVSASEVEGLTSQTTQITTPSMLDELPENKQKILAFLKELKAERENNGSQYRSEVFTDRVSAVNEIITPHVITDLLTAKRIKADSIEGLEIITSQILKTEELGGQIAGVSTSSAGLSTSDGVVKFGHVELENATVKLDLIVLGKLQSQGGLIVLGPVEFKDTSIFHALADFVGNVIFKGNVSFLGRPTFNKDTAGFAVIEKDADSVDITFEKEYETTPIVSTSFAFAEFKKEDGTADDQTIRRAKLFEQGYSSMVVNRMKKGFTIVLNKKATEDISFSWVALAVKDAKISLGKKPLPTETPQPSPSATIEPSITPAQEASPSAQ